MTENHQAAPPPLNFLTTNNSFAKRIIDGEQYNMNSITVKRDNNPIYNIEFSDSYKIIKERLDDAGINGRRVCVVSDSNVSQLYYEEVKHYIEALGAALCISIVFEAGEDNKNTDTIFSIIERLITEHFDRNDFLFALGGGVTGDMTGFAAAIYLRGIKFYQLPTSLLAMVDSSIGGKTGVDFNGYKNMVGSFHMPSGVFINISSLHTLPEREYISGYAEIIKHAVIADKNYFDYLDKNNTAALSKDTEIVKDIIYKSCKIKQAVVENDPTEKGIRAFLNFGHTIGHAIEKYMDFALLHGECVSLGMIAAAYISFGRNLISREDYESIRKLTASYKLPVCFADIKKYTAKADAVEKHKDEILSIIKSDKKADGAVIKFVLIHPVGNAIIDTTVTDAEIMKAISELGGCHD